MFISIFVSTTLHSAHFIERSPFEHISESTNDGGRLHCLFPAATKSCQSLGRFREDGRAERTPTPAELRPKAIATYQMVGNSLLNRQITGLYL